MNYLLFNPNSDSGAGKSNAEAKAKELEARFPELSLKDLTECDKSFFEALKEDDVAIVSGGDGTLNHLINDLGGKAPKAKLYLLPAGTGNDFLNDVKDAEEDGLVPLNQFIDRLPYVEARDKRMYFINGVGFGIDGECCKVAEAKLKKGAKKIDYTSITIKLILFTFKRPNATIRLDDGEPMRFKKVCIAPAMKGRFYGGGMNVAPSQDRKDGYLSSLVFHGGTRLGTLIRFTKIFTGEHIKFTKYVTLAKAKKVEVEFDRPCTVQVDGETIYDVTKYVAYAE
ncbi:MAG: diacylglycerol kinase family protein [Bacilli bacterium]|nr:diacylglycerol kinase family protein [Bacilli bacterium]